MKQIHISAILLVFLVTFSHCKKQRRYPEDPKSTFDSPKTRLQGIWNIYDYTLNGNSILATTNFGEDITSYFRIQYRFIRETKTYSTELIQSFDNDSYLTFGPFSNAANCCYIKTFITPLKCTNTNSSTNWYITKLYQDNLNLTLQTDTGEFKIFFKKTYN